MSLSRDLLRHGGLNISPAVAPSPGAISSSDGMATTPSTTLAPGNDEPVTDVRTDVYDGVTVDPLTGNPMLDLVFDGPGPNQRWEITRASIGSVSGNWDTCQVHCGLITAKNPFLTLVEESAVPNADIADESSPIFVAGGQLVTFRFIGAAALQNDDATVRIQYEQEQVS